jgi:predicted nucleic-acid-binding protein
VTGLDTNVLVRFLVEDDEAQTGRAAALIEAAVVADERLYVSDMVLCEVVWVLVGAYGFRRSEVAEVLSELTRARHLRFDSSDRIARCVRAFESGRGDFADCVIREHALEAGCDQVATFDRKLLKHEGYVSP